VVDLQLLEPLHPGAEVGTPAQLGVRRRSELAVGGHRHVLQAVLQRASEEGKAVGVVAGGCPAGDQRHSVRPAVVQVAPQRPGVGEARIESEKEERLALRRAAIDRVAVVAANALDDRR